MSKSSHTPEFRAMVAQEYLDGLGSYDSLSTKYQIGCTQFREWVAKYKQHGLPADKYCIEHNRNYKDTAGLYDVSYSQVYSWVEKVLCRCPNQKWVTDVTEFKVPGEKKLYLSTILDSYDRYPVSYVISCRNNNRLVFKTFNKAIAANPDAKPPFHSDRGFQYTSRIFKRKLKEQEMDQSMSRVGH